MPPEGENIEERLFEAFCEDFEALTEMGSVDFYRKETIADEEEKGTGSVQDLPSNSGNVRKLTTSFEHLRGMSDTDEAKQARNIERASNDS